MLFIGVATGLATAALYIGMDYLLLASRQFYFSDFRESIITILILGAIIGGAIGIGWAIVNEISDLLQRHWRDDIKHQ
jgi:hypothetical protein